MTRMLELGTLAGAGPRRRAPRPGIGAVLAAGLLVSACTALPDWADPGGWFEEPTPEPTRISAAQDLEQAQSGDFPNLASVPDAPRQATPASQRSAIAAELAADRSNARYSGERLVAGGAAPTESMPAQSAPAAPAIARQLVAPGAQTAAAQAPAAVPVQAPGRVSGATQIAPAPASPPVQASPPAQASPLPSVAQRAAQADVGIPSPAAPQLAQARRSELAGIIYFAHGSAALNAHDRSVLRDIVALSRDRDATIGVVGHASARTRTVDPVEHRVANLEVSQRRADAVAAALVQLGARRDRIRVAAQADAQPVYHEFMPTGEAGNRRVEIFLEY